MTLPTGRDTECTQQLPNSRGQPTLSLVSSRSSTIAKDVVCVLLAIVAMAAVVAAMVRLASVLVAALCSLGVIGSAWLENRQHADSVFVSCDCSFFFFPLLFCLNGGAVGNALH